MGWYAGSSASPPVVGVVNGGGVGGLTTSACDVPLGRGGVVGVVLWVMDGWDGACGANYATLLG